MPIFHSKVASNYTTISNALLCDETISFEARGMLAYLLSKPQTWQVKVTDLLRAGKCGKALIYRILNELISAGYVRTVRRRDSSGAFEQMEYEVYGSPLTDLPDVAKPDAANQDAYKELKVAKTETPSRAQVPSAIDADWTAEPEALRTLQEKHPDLKVEDEADGFRDYWLSRGEKKADWNAAFRNWCRLADTRFAGAARRQLGRFPTDKTAAISDANSERAARAMDRLAQLRGEEDTAH